MMIHYQLKEPVVVVGAEKPRKRARVTKDKSPKMPADKENIPEQEKEQEQVKWKVSATE